MANPTSIYSNYPAFIRRFGLKNITNASNKDNAASGPDLDAIQDSFDFATDEMHRVLTGGIYVVPLDFTPNNGVISKVVSEWHMVIAYENLYNSRGFDDKNKFGNKLSKLLDQVMDKLVMTRCGLSQLPCVVQVDQSPLTVDVQPRLITPFWWRAKHEVI